MAPPRHAAVLGCLEMLDQQGVIKLPEKRQSKQRFGPRIVHHERALDGPPIETELSQIGPVQLEALDRGSQDNEVWKASIDKHHYLGYRQGFGHQLRYIIRDQQGRWLGGLMFEGITKHLPCRDRWIGWTDEQRNKPRHLVVCNSRFLIFPWVKVKNLGSCVLAQAARQLPQDWQQRYHCQPVLMETFVDRRFRAHSYKGYQ
ncbi:MAG: DUF4338 domain-containing protein [Gammaproteobacteria bacterium]|nr:DUF4338 domain-containing protein [Gammaproteobacteria bacterium]